MNWSKESDYDGEVIQGFEVYASDDERVGTIDQVPVDLASQQRYLLVKTGPIGGVLPTGELYIPSTAIGMVGESRVVLEATRKQIESYGWTEPSHGFTRG